MATKKKKKANDAYDPVVNRTGAGPQGSKKGKKGYDRSREKRDADRDS